MSVLLEYKKGIRKFQYLRKFKTNLDSNQIKYGLIKVDKSLKSWLEKSDIEMHSVHNEGNAVAAERFIRTLYVEYMTSTSKNVYIVKLGDVVKKYNNTYHRTTKMKSVDKKSKTYINFNKKK